MIIINLMANLANNMRNTNDELQEELEDLQGEVKDCQKVYENDLKALTDAQENFNRSELNMYKAKVAHLEFIERIHNDN